MRFQAFRALHRVPQTWSHICEDISHEIVRACAEAFSRHLCRAFRDGEVAWEGFPEGDMIPTCYFIFVSFRGFGGLSAKETHKPPDCSRRLTASLKLL